MSKQSKTSHHNGIAQNDASISPTGTFGQDNGPFSLASPNPFGTAIFGQTIGSLAFVPVVYAGSAWSAGLSEMILHMSGVSAGTSATVSTPGSGLVFDNTYDSTCTLQYEACIVAAEEQLESLFTNADTINVSFTEGNYGNTGDALSNSSTGYDYSYATLKAALLKAAPNDVLPATDPSGGANWYVPEAYARMLGLTTTTGSPDLSVSLNTYYSWDYGQDVINGLTHELSEGGLGRIGNLGGTSGTSNWSTMDLFRYKGAGEPDYSNGKDGYTTYFSADGGATLSDQNLPNEGLPTLSFNNQFNASGTLVNSGDTADWVQENVFGSTGGGETLALTQTELEVMEALGWHLSLKQDVDGNSGSWETPANWSTGSMPIEPQDVYISGGEVTLDSNVLVNSIATSSGSTLAIGDTTSTTLIAVDGTNLNGEDSSSVASGNLGVIDVYAGSALQIGALGETFSNAGDLTIGKGAGGANAGYLDISGTVDLNGSGTVALGDGDTLGDILDASGTSGDSLVNVNNTLSGSGLIDLDSFDNQSGATVKDQNTLQIAASTFSNEGLIIAEANASLVLGQNGATESLVNAGSVNLDAGADLAISGTYTASGGGAIGFKGAGAAITSDGAAATFTNAGTIYGDYAGQIGDGYLTFDNAGTTAAGVDGVTLTIDTGSNTVTNTGTLGAENSGILAIVSGVTNQGTLEAGTTSSTGVIALGISTETQSIANGGSIIVQAGSALVIAGACTVSGSGGISFDGAGAAITSNGYFATFTNESTIDAYASAQIGDANLIFDNSGTTAAASAGATLTISTGPYSVINTGVLAAENGAALAIASSIDNSGTLEAGTYAFGVTTTGTLDLGLDGGTASANNTGVLAVYAGSDLAISGTYTVSDTGTLQLKGAGADITSDGAAPATLINASTISAFDSGPVQIGDVGIKASNDLTFSNTGSLFATGASATLTINTGANTINDTGGLLEAVNGGTLVIDSSVNTGLGGTIDADGSSMALVNGAVSGSGTLSSGTYASDLLDLAGGGSFAGVITGAGTVDIGGATTLHAGASLSATNVVETANLTLASVAITNSAGNTFTIAAGAGATAAVAASGSGSSFTNAGSLVINGAGTARITAPLVDSGAISVTAGSLQIEGPFSGTGALSIGAGTSVSITTGGILTEAISGAGALQLVGAYTLPGADVTVATLDVHTSLTGNGTLAGALIDSGTVASSGGALLVGGKVSGAGTLSAGAATVLDLAGGGSFAGAISGAGTVAIAGATKLTAGAKLSAAHVTESANVTLSGVALTNALGDVFAITAAAASTVVLGGTGSFTDAGSLLVNGAGTARISAPLIDSGAISVTSGSLQIEGPFSGTGALSIGAATSVSITTGGALTEAISGAGTLQLVGAATLSGADVTVATLDVHTSLSGHGTLAGALIGSGTVASSGGTLLVGGKVSSAGTLSAGAGTVLDLAGGGSFAGAISGAGTVAIAGATTLAAGARLSAATVADSANLTLASVGVTNTAGDVFDLTAAAGSTVTLRSSGTGAFTNDGSLAANGAGTADITAPFTNSGTVSALTGTLSFLGSVAGTGTLDLGAAGTLSLALGAASGQTVDFLGTTGVLDLAKPLDFAGLIDGFGSSDQIFLANTTFTTFGYSGGLLTVKDGTATVATLKIAENSNLFALTNENHGVLITF